MLALVIATAASGWLLGGPGSVNRKTMALTTGVRNVGVTLVIVTTSFPGSRALTAALVYGIFQTIALALLALGWGRWASAKDGILGDARSPGSLTDRLAKGSRP